MSFNGISNLVPAKLASPGMFPLLKAHTVPHPQGL